MFHYFRHQIAKLKNKMFRLGCLEYLDFYSIITMPLDKTPASISVNYIP